MPLSYPNQRPLLPRAPLSHNTTNDTQPMFPNGQEAPEAFPKMRTRGPKTAKRTNEEWEAIKASFHKLYVEQDLPLEKTMALIKGSHGFTAS